MYLVVFIIIIITILNIYFKYKVFQTGYTSTHEQILRSTDTRMFGKSQCERVKKLFDLWKKVL